MLTQAKTLSSPVRVSQSVWLSPSPLHGPIIQRSVSAGPAPCACGGGCPRCKAEAVQTKLAISEPGDPLEREADRVAEAAIADTVPASPVTVPHALQRQCTACEEEEPIRRRISGGAVSRDHTEDAATAVEGGGSPLAPDLRAYFEPFFGRTFSGVRIHVDNAAATAASNIGAHAYTLGNDIAFAAGAFMPNSPHGRKLIAHELAHVVQQAPFIARQPAPYYSRQFPERSGGGTTDFIETVQVAPSPNESAAIEGTVDRSEVAPASDTQPRQTIHTGQVRNIRFDPSCFIKVPYGIRFLQQPTADPPFCQMPPSATPVSPLPDAQFQGLQTRYIDALNAGLNGWYALRVEGCQQPCAARPIPIRIEARAVTNNEDQTVDIVNRSGRGNSGTICAGAFDPGFAVHEGGHQVLGLGDEYREENLGLRQKHPNWARDERERTDLTYMGSHNKYGRFVMYHERHFRFAQVFLEAVYRGRGCTVRLEELRGRPVDFRVEFGLGYASTNAGGNLSLTAAFTIGLPLERMRRFNLLLGAQGQWLADLSYSNRNAFLLGARLGLEAQTTPGSFGVAGNIFTTGGFLHRSEGSPSTPARTAPYGEIGAGIGIKSGMMSNGNLHVLAEAALGKELSNDPNAMSWLRLGLNFGASF